MGIDFWSLIIIANMYIANDKNESGKKYIQLAVVVLIINIIMTIIGGE